MSLRVQQIELKEEQLAVVAATLKMMEEQTK